MLSGKTPGSNWKTWASSLDFSGVSSGIYPVTCISPQDAIRSAHVTNGNPIAPGTTFSFTGTDSAAVTMTVASCEVLSGTSGCDYTVIHWTTPLPENVSWYKVLPSDVATYANLVAGGGIDAIWVNQFGDQIVESWVSSSQPPASHEIFYSPSSGSTERPFWTFPVVGDSSQPKWLWTGSELILLALTNAGANPASPNLEQSPSIQLFSAIINSGLTSAGSVYQLSAVDLSGFTSFSGASDYLFPVTPEIYNNYLFMTYWIGTVSSAFSNSGNWSAGIPTTGSDAIFVKNPPGFTWTRPCNGTVPAHAYGNFTVADGSTLTIELASTSFTSVTLSGGSSVSNNSTSSVTFGTFTGGVPIGSESNVCLISGGFTITGDMILDGAASVGGGVVSSGTFVWNSTGTCSTTTAAQPITFSSIQAITPLTIDDAQANGITFTGGILSGSISFTAGSTATFSGATTSASAGAGGTIGHIGVNNT